MNRVLLMNSKTKRNQRIFFNSSKIKYEYLPCFIYETICVERQIFEKINNGNCNWILFTSFKAWQYFLTNIRFFNLDINPKVKIGVFGEVTSSRIKKSGQKVDYCSKHSKSISFIKEFIKILDENITLMYFASTASNNSIEKLLGDENVFFERHNLYSPKVKINSKNIKSTVTEFNPDSLVFFSSNSVKVFFEKCPVKVIDKIKSMNYFAIGEKTANTLKQFSIDAIMPSSPSYKKLSEIIN